MDWTLQIPAGDALSWGTYAVVATATDAAGNVGTFDFDSFFDPARLKIDVPDGVLAGVDTAGWAVSAVLVVPGQLPVGMASSTGQPLAVGLREIAQLQFRVERTSAAQPQPSRS